MKFVKVFSVILGSTLIAGIAGATGYEKATPFSAERGGFAGAGTSHIKGPNSLFYNPAGLGQTNGMELSLSVSPLIASSEGVILTTEKSDTTFLPPFGVTLSKQFSEDFSAGLGIYNVGGLAIDYGTVDFDSQSFTAFDPEYKANIVATEFALGGAYQVVRNLYLGLTWRITYVTAEFASASVVTSDSLPGGNALVQTRLNDLSDWSFGSFRAGAQYLNDDRTAGVSLTFRTETKFQAEGSGSGEVSFGAAPSSSTELSDDSVSVENRLPLAFGLGFHTGLGADNTLIFDYTWVNYSKNQQLSIDATLVDDGSTISLPVSNVEQGWRNAHIARLGFENRSWLPIPVRAGFAMSTEVTPNENANPLFESPSNPHFVFALGTAVNVSDAFRLDFASDFSTFGEDVSGGESKTTVFTFHVSGNVAL